MTDHGGSRYIRPTGFDMIFNRTVGLITKMGISVMGSRVLAVKGRTSGLWRTSPVNLLTVDGVRYLVAPRGQAQWVRNIRVAGGGELRLGRKVEPFTVTEVPDADKAPVIRAYLLKWSWEVGRFFDGLGKDATDREITEVAPGFPVFRIN